MQTSDYDNTRCQIEGPRILREKNLTVSGEIDIIVNEIQVLQTCSAHIERDIHMIC